MSEQTENSQQTEDLPVNEEGRKTDDQDTPLEAAEPEGNAEGKKKKLALAIAVIAAVAAAAIAVVFAILPKHSSDSSANTTADLPAGENLLFRGDLFRCLQAGNGAISIRPEAM